MKKKLNNKTNFLQVIASIATIFTMIWIATTQNKIMVGANIIAEELKNNSERDSELFEKQVNFEVIASLYREFHHFVDTNQFVIEKLAKKQQIENLAHLRTFLNTFETVEEQCRLGVISRENVRVNFKHFLEMSCNNEQVVSVVNTGANGLKLLCRDFVPDSIVGKMAQNIEEYNCM